MNSLTLTMFFRRFVVLNVIKRQIHIGLAKKVFFFFLMSSFRTFLFFKSCIWCTEYVLFVYEMEDEAEHQHLILFLYYRKRKIIYRNVYKGLPCICGVPEMVSYILREIFLMRDASCSDWQSGKCSWTRLPFYNQTNHRRSRFPNRMWKMNLVDQIIICTRMCRMGRMPLQNECARNDLLD